MRNFNHLYYFYVVAKLKSVTAAANELNTSQSSLSTQIKTLEGQMGKKLFSRDGRALALTPTGQQIFHYCKRMFEVATEMEGFLYRREHQGRSTFAIGVSLDIERPYVTDILARAMNSSSQAKRPRPVVILTSYPHEKLAAKLEIGELDVVLSSQPIHSNTARTHLEVRLPVKAIARADRTKASKPVLQDETAGLVLPTLDMKIRWEIDEFLLKKKIRRGIAFESNVMGAIVRACVDGLGIGFLPEAYVAAEIKRGTLAISRESLWMHRLFLSTRKTGGISSTSEDSKSADQPVAQTMVNALTEQLKN